MIGIDKEANIFAVAVLKQEAEYFRQAVESGGSQAKRFAQIFICYFLDDGRGLRTADIIQNAGGTVNDYLEIRRTFYLLLMKALQGMTAWEIAHAFNAAAPDLREKNPDVRFKDGDNMRDFIAKHGGLYGILFLAMTRSQRRTAAERRAEAEELFKNGTVPELPMKQLPPAGGEPKTER